jgi:hypothetical protein
LTSMTCADRSVMDIVDAAETVIGHAPAPWP